MKRTILSNQDLLKINYNRIKLHRWHYGILALWHFGILAFWHFGILAFWHFGILTKRSTRPLIELTLFNHQLFAI